MLPAIPSKSNGAFKQVQLLHLVRFGDTFSITNTKPETPAGNHPQTGDTTNMTLYVLLMAASGLALLVVGIVLRKKSRAK